MRTGKTHRLKTCATRRGSPEPDRPQVETHLDKQASKKLAGKVDALDVHVTASPTLAVVHYDEKGENVIDGKQQPVNIRATATFRGEGGQWRVIGHHTDTLAYLQQERIRCGIRAGTRPHR
jgi:ketosteroid isomerase-like protein